MKAGDGCGRLTPSSLLLAALFHAVVACGPAETPDSGSVVDAVEAVDSQPTCHPARQRATGECCPTGTFYDFETSECLPIGPPECAAVLPHAPESCTPRWCADLRDSQGAPCDGTQLDCIPQGRLCTAAEIAADAGCAPGWWPAPSRGGKCTPAGLPSQWQQEPGKSGALEALPPLLAPPDVPPLVPLPKLAATAFCHDKAAQKTRICPLDDKGCGPGAMPDPDQPDGCLPVGVPWVCPPGFVADVATAVPAGQLVTCEPDPAACGDGKWPPKPAGTQARYVDASAATGGDGSKGKPFKTLVAGLSATLAGDSLLLAAGTYTGGVALDRALRVIGRCAAKVTITGLGNTPVLHLSGGPPESQVRIEGVRITGKSGGIRVDGPVKLRLDRVHIANSVAFGLFVWGKWGQAQAFNLVISNTVAGAGQLGFGVAAGGGAKVDLVDTRLRRNTAMGTLVQHDGSRLRAERILIDDTQAAADGFSGVGILVSAAGRLELRSARLHANRVAGILLTKAKSELVATATVIDATKAQVNDSKVGFGLGLSGPVQATLRGVRLHGNRTFGIFTPNTTSGGKPGQGGTLKASGLLIDGTLSQLQDETAGFGMAISVGASADLYSARLSGNRGAGLSVSEVGSQLMARGLLVDGTLPESHTGTGGEGLVGFLGAQIVLDGARFTGNRVNGIYLNHPSSRMFAQSLLVDQTMSGKPLLDAKAQAGSPKQGGTGLQVLSGATAIVAGARLSRNRTVGILVAGNSASIRATGLLIDETQPRDADALHGIGALVTPSADLSLVGTRIVGSHTVGVHARDNAVSTRLVGTSIERTEVDATYGWLGAGAWFKEVDGVQVLASRFDRNRAAGLILDTTTATIEGTMVLETLQAKFAAPDAKEGDTPFEMADGVLLRLGSGVTVLRSLVFQQPRAGLLAHASPKVVVQKTFVSDCGFGLALIETDGVQVKGNLLHGNDQNLATDSLPVPPAPDLADL